jgi:phage tail sheath protein FI
VTDFLLAEWRVGALKGNRPEDALFVRCDRMTVSQGDLDDGRAICLVSVAVVRPAEFVVFRIGVQTAV